MVVTHCLILFPSIYVFGLARFCLGVGSGCILVVGPIIVSEQLPRCLSAKLSVLFYIWLTSGVLLAAWFGFLWHTEGGAPDLLTKNWVYL